MTHHDAAGLMSQTTVLLLAGIFILTTMMGCTSPLVRVLAEGKYIWSYRPKPNQDTELHVIQGPREWNDLLKLQQQNSLNRSLRMASIDFETESVVFIVRTESTITNKIEFQPPVIKGNKIVFRIHQTIPRGLSIPAVGIHSYIVLIRKSGMPIQVYVNGKLEVFYEPSQRTHGVDY